MTSFYSLTERGNCGTVKANLYSKLHRINCSQSFNYYKSRALESLFKTYSLLLYARFNEYGTPPVQLSVRVQSLNIPW
jgi:hypothetical protein